MIIIKTLTRKGKMGRRKTSCMQRCFFIIHQETHRLCIGYCTSIECG